MSYVSALNIMPSNKGTYAMRDFVDSTEGQTMFCRKDETETQNQLLWRRYTGLSRFSVFVSIGLNGCKKKLRATGTQSKIL